LTRFVFQYAWKSFGQFRKILVTRKVIKVEFFFHFCLGKLGHSGKIMVLKKFRDFENFILPDNYVHLINVEENFHLCPKILGTLEISSCLKTLGSLGNFCLIFLGRLWRWKNIFGVAHHPMCSHMKISVLVEQH